MMRPSLSLRQFGERGFALISVLWGVALLTLIAATVLSASAASRRSSHIAIQRAQAEALAEAGINDAILSLLAPQPGGQRRIDGTPYVMMFSETQIWVSIQDENGKIDLNHADSALLKRLFTSVGVSPDESAALSDRILDWRESDTGHRLNGATAADYLAAGYEYQPRHKPFQSVDELKLVMGMTPDLFARVSPALTVYSHRGAVNPLTAPEPVRFALNMSAGANANRSSDANALAASIAFTDWAFTIRAELAMPSGRIYRREAVVRITSDPSRPYWIHAWREVLDE